MILLNGRSRSIIVMLLAAVILLALAPASSAKTHDMARNELQVKIPASLTWIEEEAFAGTAFQLVVLDEKLTYIGEKAFGGAQDLQSVYISENTAYIGAEAFPADTMIHGREGSYAQQWAEENGYRFQCDNAWNIDFTPLLSLLLLVQTCLFAPAVDTRHEYRFRRVKAYLRDMRPQKRSELYPINYRFP